ncbi:MAG: putative transposase [Zhongshania aliphaticivorans]|jgi:putative transposase
MWIALAVYLMVAFARYSAKEGWAVQCMLRVLQLNLFERKALVENFNPNPPLNQKDQPQMRLVL